LTRFPLRKSELPATNRAGCYAGIQGLFSRNAWLNSKPKTEDKYKKLLFVRLLEVLPVAILADCYSLASVLPA
jgi:hypothetical protein